MKHISHGYSFPQPSPQGIPALEIIDKLFLKIGIDPNFLMNIAMFITVLASFGGFLAYEWAGLRRIWDFISATLTSSATIHSSDQTYLYVTRWLALNKISTDCRLFCVTSKKNPNSSRVKRFSYFTGPRGGSSEPDDDSDEEEDEFGPKIRYTPAPGISYFWYKKHLIIINRKIDLTFYTGDTPDETMILTTIGRSPVLLRCLLNEARECYYSSQRQKTTIFNAIADGRFDKRWDSGRPRPSRSISTVIMHDKDKEEILSDAREYLKPATAKWYADRGLPYRRGYLFYGPPGTGKTSLTVALAGELKLALYIFNLGIGGGLTDESLGYLFQSLPRKCIVLLEDIDCVGIGRLGGSSRSNSLFDAEEERRRSQTGTATPKDGNSGDDNSVNNSGQHGRVQQRANQKAQPPRHHNEQKISFSGLLNAIDGVGSHEGRLLIMTTNHVERLDPALIRPGRVDVRIEFGFATKDVASRIFKELYKGTPGYPEHPIEDDGCGCHSSNPVAMAMAMDDDILFQPSPVQEKGCLQLCTDFTPCCPSNRYLPNDIQSLSQAFADEIPPKMFTPAELQGYLIRHKNNPPQAVIEVGDWVKDKIGEKVKGRAVTGSFVSVGVMTSQKKEERLERREQTKTEDGSVGSVEPSPKSKPVRMVNSLWR